MTTYIALLRAVNVGGHAVVKMTDLRAAFERAGAQAVRTYIQSGNVIYEAAPGRAAAVARAAEKEVAALVGEPSKIIIRDAEAWAAVVAHAPFGQAEDGVKAKHYIAFLEAMPKKARALPWASAKDGWEVLRADPLEVYFVLREVRGRYTFPNPPIEKELGVGVTARNWNTVRKLMEIAAAPPKK